MTFDKTFMKKSYHFLTSSKFLLYRKILRTADRWQLNDYRKYPLNNSQIFFVCLVYVNYRYMKYLIFTVSRICIIRHFQYFHYSNIAWLL